MAKKMQFRDRWVLVTGASSGLGEEMAYQLAAKYGANLVLVARRAERLESLAQTLRDAYQIDCQVIGADLSHEDDVARVFAESTREHAIYAVILNAGITHFGRHADLSWSAFRTLLATNVSSVVQLASLFVPYLAERSQDGGLMLVSSMAGLLPVPYQSAYAGSKAFVTNFGQSLAQEIRGSGVSVTVFSPGGIATPMTHDSDLRYFENTAFLQPVRDCAAQGLQAFRARKGLFVPGRLNRLQLLMSRLVPRKVIASVAASAYRKALPAEK